jgi:hypothetical protein
MTTTQFMNLKKGDKVIVNRTALGQFTKGKTYTVLRTYIISERNTFYMIKIRSDDNKRVNGWRREYFDIKTSSPAW